MRKSTAVLLLLALFSGSAVAASGLFKDSKIVIGCYDEISGNKFMYNLKTYKVFTVDKYGVTFYTIYDSTGVAHTLSKYMTDEYLKCKEVKL